MIQGNFNTNNFGVLIQIFCCYGYFLSLLARSTRLKKWLPVVISCLVFIGMSLLLGAWSILGVILFLYLLFKTELVDWLVLNKVLLTATVISIVSIAAKLLVKAIFHAANDNWQMMVVYSLVLTVGSGVASLITKLAKRPSWLRQRNLMLIAILQAILLIIINSTEYIAHELLFFDRFTLGILVFVAVELLVMGILFIFVNFRMRNHYQEKLEKQQLENLMGYTAQLEQSQLELRKFRHDYNNILLSVGELAKTNANSDLKQYLASLKIYSHQHLQQGTDNYQDIQNVNDEHVKSILLNKFFTMQQLNLNFKFECRYPVKQIKLNTIDMVRLLSILLDNAIEETKRVKSGKIEISMLQNGDALEIVLENPLSTELTNVEQLSEAGYSQKANHSGLGLAIIADMQRKYQNLVVQYSTTAKKFAIQVTIV